MTATPGMQAKNMGVHWVVGWADYSVECWSELAAKQACCDEHSAEWQVALPTG
jgi:hypothetical protein